MEAMTVRGIDPELEIKLAEAAHKQGKGANKVLIDVIQNPLVWTWWFF